MDGTAAAAAGGDAVTDEV